MDEVRGVRIYLQNRPVSGDRHPPHERSDDIATEVSQPVKRTSGNKRLLVSEGQKDRLLDLGEFLIQAIGVVPLQLRHHGVDVEDEDIGPLLQLLGVTLDQSDALLGMKSGILA